MTISIARIALERHDISTRMPFKYGIATMTDVPHLFARIEARIAGQLATGISADHLPPKWFTKVPEKDPLEEIDEMLAVVQHAAKLAEAIEAPSVFAFWLQLYNSQAQWADERKMPPLLAHFGTSLIERALIDAFCRHQNKPFHRVLIENDFKIDWAPLRPALAEHMPSGLLPKRPLSSIIARHTVGLADPLWEGDIEASERLNDGLPQSLEACIRFYGLQHFKIKVNGQETGDTERLASIARLLEHLDLQDFAITIDGNEQFKTMDAFRGFWEKLCRNPALSRFLEYLIFVEQPVHRDHALESEIGNDLSAWKDAPPIIIDESDATLESMPNALELGYQGTSHKNCKGVFKGIINRAHIELLNRQNGNPDYLMSGEDLANIGPVANHQDLVVQSALGIRSVERNGHHYFRGLTVFDERLQRAAADGAPRLYSTAEGYPRVNLRGGKIDLTDLLALPFGVSIEA